MLIIYKKRFPDEFKEFNIFNHKSGPRKERIRLQIMKDTIVSSVAN